MRKPDKTPTPVEPDEKSVNRKSYANFHLVSYPDRKWRRDLIRKPDIHSWATLVSTMSQVNFFMTEDDEAAFLDFLFSRSDTHVLKGRFFESRNPTPLSSKDEVGQVDELTLVNKEIMPEPIAGSRGPGGYLFDMFYDPSIEFSRCRTSKNRLLNGRIYAKIGWLKPKEANAVYKKWYGSIERWLKKQYSPVDKMWWFGPGAWEWSMAGGVCCFGGELAFASSLATVDKAWLKA